MGLVVQFYQKAVNNYKKVDKAI